MCLFVNNISWQVWASTGGQQESLPPRSNNVLLVCYVFWGVSLLGVWGPLNVLYPLILKKLGVSLGCFHASFQAFWGPFWVHCTPWGGGLGGGLANPSKKTTASPSKILEEAFFGKKMKKNIICGFNFLISFGKQLKSEQTQFKMKLEKIVNVSLWQNTL